MTEATNTSDTETIYVFDPPGGAWYSTPLVAGDLCFALGQRGDGNVDIAVYHSTVCEDASGTYLGVVSPECLRLATEAECTGVVPNPGLTPEEIEARKEEVTGIWKVVNDEGGHPKPIPEEEDNPEGWTDTGFRGTFAECDRHIDKLRR